MMKILAALIALPLLISFGQTPKRSTPGAPGAAAEPKYTSITLKRTPCFGFCPTYSVTLNRDGTATYTGERGVEMVGEYRNTETGLGGTLFLKLAKLAEAIEFDKLEARYEQRITDLPSTITTLRTNARKKTVTNYGGFAPIELWGFEMAVDAAVARLKWEPVGESAGQRKGGAKGD